MITPLLNLFTALLADALYLKNYSSRLVYRKSTKFTLFQNSYFELRITSRTDIPETELERFLNCTNSTTGICLIKQELTNSNKNNPEETQYIFRYKGKYSNSQNHFIDTLGLYNSMHSSVIKQNS